jgi:hypothetical protein
MEDVAGHLGGLFQHHAVGADLAIHQAADADRFGLQGALHGSTFTDGDVAALDVAFDPAIDLHIAAAHQIAGDPEIGTDDGGDAGFRGGAGNVRRAGRLAGFINL